VNAFGFPAQWQSEYRVILLAVARAECDVKFVETKQPKSKVRISRRQPVAGHFVPLSVRERVLQRMLQRRELESESALLQDFRNYALA
jgi:hypothetical protein